MSVCLSICLFVQVLKPRCVRLWPLDAEKSDGGRRKKWREKNKTTVGWRAFEVLKSRSWEPNIEGLKPRCWDPNTEGLKPKSWNLALRAWNPGPESQVLKLGVEVLKPRSSEHACVINWLKQLTVCLSVQVLKPRSQRGGGGGGGRPGGGEWREVFFFFFFIFFGSSLLILGVAGVA